MTLWELQARTPSLLVASIKSGKGTGLMLRLGDHCQGVACLDGFGLHVERWNRVVSKEGIEVWEKDHQSTTWIRQEENTLMKNCRPFPHFSDSGVSLLPYEYTI